MTEAAKRLRVDATTVGRRIERLELSLNAELFEQSANGHQLTAGGQQLLQHAEDMERSTSDISTVLTGGRSRLEGNVRLSISEGLATAVVARCMSAFRKDNPSIELEIAITNGFLNLSKREADLAVMLARPRKGPLVARKLTDYSLGLYASKDYLASNPVAQVSDLFSHSLIGYIPDFIYAEELRYMEEVSPGLKPTLTSNSINVQHILTRSGCGVAILPHFMAVNDDQLAPLLPDVEIHRSFWIVVHQDMVKVARVRAVVEWLDRLAGEKIPTRSRSSR